ncbi:hypothetical protein B0T20DRAFT_468130 [Sordaria brevicollis]|uniref:Uncharacterized protein n=1 Tax=Sordaria brevicollis TaxID=83679 RepID=A0AAE0PH04_SORBR|nr:hypothetical protein B0T20DRAFT_468130 [Sordaria brevicollis]
MSANDYYHNIPNSSSTNTSDTRQNSSHSYPPHGQGQANHHHVQFQDHNTTTNAPGCRRSSAISIPAGAAGVSLNPHLAQGFLTHPAPGAVPNNTPANGTHASGHPNTSHFCPIGQESTTTTHGVNGHHVTTTTTHEQTGTNGPEGFSGADGSNGPDGERGLGATLVGGATGHFLSHQLGHNTHNNNNHGHGNGHHGLLGSAAGAVAANLIEHQLKKSHDHHAHDMGHSGGGGHSGGAGGLSGLFGDGGGHHQSQQQHHQTGHHGQHGQHGQHGVQQEYVHEYGDDHGQGGVRPYPGSGHHGKRGKWGH